MALREIDENEYAALQVVHGSVAEMLKMPAARKLLLQARKTANPNAVIPEIDAAAPINDAVSDVKGMVQTLTDRLDKEARERAEAETIAKFQGKWAAQKDELRQKGWRGAGIEAVVAFAEENGIADLTIAADAYSTRHPDPAPETGGRSNWDMFNATPDKEDTFVEDLMKSGGPGGVVDERRVDREIRETIAAVRQAQR